MHKLSGDAIAIEDEDEDNELKKQLADQEFIKQQEREMERYKKIYESQKAASQ